MQIDPRKALKEGWLSSCEYTQCQQNGIDVTIAEDLELEHTEHKEIMCNEIIRVPMNVIALFFNRSTYNRQGVIIRGSLWDSGFQGVVSLSVYNLSSKKLTIKKNTRIAQVVFFEGQAASMYDGQYQNQGLKDV